MEVAVSNSKVLNDYVMQYINTPLMQERLETKSFFGSYLTEKEAKIKSSQCNEEIDISKTAFVINNLTMEKRKVKADITILDTPRGLELKNQIKNKQIELMWYCNYEVETINAVTFINHINDLHYFILKPENK